MVSRSPFLFPVYKRHFVFYGDHYLSVSDIRPVDWAPPKNVGIAAGISQICYSYQKIFLFPVYKRHFVFNGDHYLYVSDIRPLDWAPPKM